MNHELKPVSFGADAHPDENQLLLALERELTIEDAARVEQHLGNCWSCRARYDEMQQGILAFVEYREKRYLPSLATPPDNSSGFRDHLRHYSGGTSPASLLTRIWRKLTDLIVLPRQLKWASAAATVMAIVIVWVHIVNPPVVSASELLTRAVAAQNPPGSGKTTARRRIAHQKMQIRSGKQSVVRDFEWTVGSSLIKQTRWETKPDPLTWNVPLTAEGFAVWRDSLREKKDTVRRERDLLTLDTAAAGEGLIKDAWLVVRAHDFHPVEQHLRFTDDQRLDFTELAFRIDDETQPARDPRSEVAIEQKPSSPAAVQPPDLDETELQLRYTLFEHQWDLGEDLVIGRTSRQVILNGIISSRQREVEMRTTLSALPNVRFAVDLPTSSNATGAKPIRAMSTQGQSPLLEDDLEKAFTSRDERLAFVDRCLTDSDAALSHAWALKKLVTRYNEHEEQLLKPQSNQKLLEMLNAHIEKLGRANSDLTSLLNLLPPSDHEASAIPANWRARIVALFSAVQQEDRLVSGLVAGSQTDGQNLATASANLRVAHETVQVLVAGLKDLKGDPITQ